MPKGDHGQLAKRLPLQPLRWPVGGLTGLGQLPDQEVVQYRPVQARGPVLLRQVVDRAVDRQQEQQQWLVGEIPQGDDVVEIERVAARGVVVAPDLQPLVDLVIVEVL